MRPVVGHNGYLPHIMQTNSRRPLIRRPPGRRCGFSNSQVLSVQEGAPAADALVAGRDADLLALGLAACDPLVVERLRLAQQLAAAGACREIADDVRDADQA
jgi:hypothetical protein